MESTTDMNPQTRGVSHLLNLPAEIRLRIFSEVLDEYEVEKSICSCKKTKLTGSRALDIIKDPKLAIMLVNKQFAAETRDFAPAGLLVTACNPRCIFEGIDQQSEKTRERIIHVVLEWAIPLPTVLYARMKDRGTAYHGAEDRIEEVAQAWGLELKGFYSEVSILGVSATGGIVDGGLASGGVLGENLARMTVKFAVQGYISRGSRRYFQE